MSYRLSHRQLFALLLLLWILINILQSVFTEINSDEAYYYFYSSHLSWGYYDHPPLVALLVRIGSFFFNGNMGVRFVTVLLQALTLILTWLIVDKKDANQRSAILLFFTIAASLVMFSVYGFTTTPDSSLLFFTALFIYAYKAFLKSAKWSSILLLSIAMAGLVYSKYQGALVILFTLLSNFRLLKNTKFLFACFSSVLLYVPHLWWQYANDFPSLNYHLIRRSKSFRWSYILEYLPNQAAAFNPFTLGALLFALIRIPAASVFQRSLYFIVVGLLIFFGLTAIRGHVEPQWTVAAAIPALIIITEASLTKERFRKYIQIIVAASLLLVVAARIILVSGLLPHSLKLSGKEAYYKSVEKIAGDRPVVFGGSYQDASLYRFFTGKSATVISSFQTRRTQFDLWRPEKHWEPQPVFICGKFDGLSKTYILNDHQVNGFIIDHLPPVNRLLIDFTLQKTKLTVGEYLSIPFTIQNPTGDTVSFRNSQFPVKLAGMLLNKKEQHELNGNISDSISQLLPGQKISSTLKIEVPDLTPGNFLISLSCHTIFGPHQNAPLKQLTILP